MNRRIFTTADSPDGSWGSSIDRRPLVAPEGYQADDRLRDAVSVSLHLGQPLLLTGEPGTGKTQLAFSLAWELGLGTPLGFDTKSTSTSRDLFYSYDSLGRFHAAQAGGGTANPIDYLHFNALGLAVLRATPPESYSDLKDALGETAHRKRSVVLIDEIDKAPRDFSNDLLAELEEMYFRIPELANLVVAADPEYRPIVVVTSNSERNLPDAFLRRCAYHHIEFPDRDRMQRIVAARLGERVAKDRESLDLALDFFEALRDPATTLAKKPSTGEFLVWLRILSDRGVGRNPREWGATLSALVKTSDDSRRALGLLARFRTLSE